ncbi:MAG TPA: 2-oxoacid:acceptor oxidoreductase subunit alpha [Candidatus Polarisedimenticolia bacterium]|nr:2-oxoacid:acceptor oxidoreductase subunit alpha [Candidatus Polarisedimenticolia bacterium]
MTTETQIEPQRSAVQELDEVVIRFAGDSGDGMQLTGSQFADTTALFGNDLATLPDYPAEIRAPAGTLAGVSGYQINFSSHDIRTPGDQPNVLVAMNPAALRTNLDDLEDGGILILDSDAFTDGNLNKAGYKTNPLRDGSLGRYRTFEIPLTSLTLKAVSETGLGGRHAARCKNFFALGLVFWMYERPVDHTRSWIEKKFKTNEQVKKANTLALQAGYNYADTVEVFTTHYRVKKAVLPEGTYKSMTGNEATANGFIAAALLSGRPLFYGSYPITPASDILHELARHKNYPVKTFQAEDEISAIGSAIGAAYGGALGLTGTSGPGVALKGEAIGLAVMTELPLVIANIQRGGPSTGLPTKTEQADLFQAILGRNGECPVAVIAPATPAECFYMAIEAFRIAVKFMTPVFFLSDGYLANGSEPFRIPDVSTLPRFDVEFCTRAEGFQPYARDPETLARPWAIPGTPGLEHRIGGLEKEDITGNVSYDPRNHEKMVRLRAEKIARIADFIPEAQVTGAPSGKVLVVGWGSTHGAITSGVEAAQRQGKAVSSLHLRHLNPFPKNLGDVLNRFEKVLVAELNLGQLRMLLRARYLVDAEGLNKVQGKPFKVSEITAAIDRLLGANQKR